MSKSNYEPSFIFENKEESEVYVSISLEEYKELLEIRGRYNELKEIYDRERFPAWSPSKITWNGTDITCKEPDCYTYTCGCNHK